MEDNSRKCYANRLVTMPIGPVNKGNSKGFGITLWDHGTNSLFLVPKIEVICGFEKCVPAKKTGKFIAACTDVAHVNCITFNY